MASGYTMSTVTAAAPASPTRSPPCPASHPAAPPPVCPGQSLHRSRTCPQQSDPCDNAAHSTPAARTCVSKMRVGQPSMPRRIAKSCTWGDHVRTCVSSRQRTCDDACSTMSLHASVEATVRRSSLGSATQSMHARTSGVDICMSSTCTCQAVQREQIKTVADAPWAGRAGRT